MKPPWTKHSQTEYLRLSTNDDAPAFLRIAWLAMGNHRANRHAEFKHGDLAKALAGDKKRYRGLDQAIEKAIQYGLLDEKSTRRCLVVPLALVEGPPQGKPNDACPTHDTGKPRVKAECHPDRPHHAKGECNPCYQARLRREAKEGEIRLRAV